MCFRTWGDGFGLEGEQAHASKQSNSQITVYLWQSSTACCILKSIKNRCACSPVPVR
jgi:hypothetical protein